MKRKLSFLLALVFVLTLAFGVLPGVPAEAANPGDTYGLYKLIYETPDTDPPTPVPAGTYSYTTMTYGTANVIVIKQSNSFVVWVDSTVDQTTVITAVQELGSSYKNMTSYAITDQTSFNYGTVLGSTKNSENFNVTINTTSKTFTIDQGISHYTLLKYGTDPEVGSMTVKKLLARDSETTYSASQEFEFKVVFTKDGQPITTGITYSSANGGTAEPQLDGSFLIKLKINEQGTFADIPKGTWYEVTERPLPANWQPALYLSEGGNDSGDTTSDGKGKIVNAGASDEVKVTNKYIGPNVGSLTVQKVIRTSQSTPYNADQNFTIIVKFTEGSLTGTAINSGIMFNGNPVTSTNGEYTITLKIGQEGTFTNIPVGAWYTVTEPSGTLPLYWESAKFEDEDAGSNDNDHDGTGKIDIKNDSDTVKVRNKYVPDVGALKVWKNVITPGPTGIPFPISVTFTLPSGIYNSITISDHAAVTPTVTGNTYTYTFTLNRFGEPNSHIIFNNIPIGTTYTVNEGALLAGWSFNGFDRHNYIGDDTPNEVLDKIEYKNDTDTVGVKNTYTKPVFGALDVTKTVTGKDASTSQLFAVKVTFTNASTVLNDIKLNGSLTPITLDSTGSYTVNLTGGQTAHFTNIPKGTTYAVAEQPLDSTLTAAGWSITNGTASGTITDETLITATITNKFDPRGSLKVTKTVITDGAPAADFNIKVAFTVPEGSSAADITYSGGVGTVAGQVITFSNVILAHAGTATFTNIPMGTTYAVTEPTVPTYWSTTPSITPNNGAGTIASVKQVDITVTNAYVPKGELTVGKLLTESLIKTYGNKVFTITVTFTGPNLNDIGVDIGDLDPSPVTGSNGSYTLTLRHGETVKFTNIPIGTQYAVTETLTEAGWRNMTVEPTSGTLTLQDFVDDVKIINGYTKPETGMLTVTKEVTGDNASTSQEFAITVQFTMPETDNSYFKGIEKSNAEGSNGTYTMSLRDGESAFFADIPLNATYTVTEQSIPSYWTLVSTLSELTGTISSNQSTGAIVTVTNRFDAPSPTTSSPPALSELTVDKLVTGADASEDEKFDFIVTFTGSYGTIANNAGLDDNDTGVYTFSLSANDTPVKFSNIPNGVSYTVEEKMTDPQIALGWVVDSSNGLTGTIETAGTIAAATVTNTIGGVAAETDKPGEAVLSESDKLPQTGGIATSTLLGIFGLALIALGGTTILVFRKKNDGKTK